LLGPLVQGECKHTFAAEEGHRDWVSCVRFPPVMEDPIIVSCGWDKVVKVSHGSVTAWGSNLLPRLLALLLFTECVGGRGD
jgi:hypothetical protein